MLAVLAFLLNQSSAERDVRREAQRQAQQDRIALDNRREDAIQTYLTRMADLMLSKGLLAGAPGANATKDVATVGRTLTLTVLPRLNGKQKARVIEFLAEAGLIRFGSYSDPSRPRLQMSGADLRHADFRGLGGLGHVNLQDTDLTGAIFDGTELTSSSFETAALRGASFKGARLASVDFQDVDLKRARFDGAVIGTEWPCEPHGECGISPHEIIDPPIFSLACLSGASFVDVLWDDMPPSRNHVGALDDAEGVGVDLRQRSASRFVGLNERRQRVSRAIGAGPHLVDVKLDPSVRRPAGWNLTGARLSSEDQQDLCP